ncbi:MAG TPA: dTDP-glucose 4,6-dehydratase [Candidatus Acidoferrales bacterium]|nr:dTDP-glucose 4,6-dehydratase [Candidatus Acidoferrales bacterium]
MKLVVTGGAGFIGSNFIRYFLGAYPDAEILNFDKLTYAGNLQNLEDIDASPNYRFVRGDICDAEAVEEALADPADAIVHFAAESHVDRSIAGAREFLRTNVEGTLVMMEAARKRKIPRFLHVSTDEVYGSMAPKESATEQSVLAPNSPYAASKAAADLLVRSYVQTHKFPAVITRCTNNYGPYQFPEKLIPLMISNAFESKKLPVYGDGSNERDWIFVEDHCRALDAVLQKGRVGEIYNIGSGRPVPNIGIVRSLLKLLDKPDGLIEFVQDRPGHDRRYALDDSKIRHELGWEPKVELDAGLEHTVDWYRKHIDWVHAATSGEYQAYYEKFYVKRRTTLAEL